MTAGTVEWNWYLGETSTLSKIGLLSGATSKSITCTLNDRESAQFVLSLLDPLAPELYPVDTCIMCYRNGEMVWSGPVFTLDKTIPDMTVQVGCLGWFEYYNHWLLPTANLGTWTTAGDMTSTTLSYPNYTSNPNATIDQCAIMADLLGIYGQNLIAAGAPSWMQALTTGAVPNTSPYGNRIITYQEFQNLGQAIQQMSGVEFGFDFHVDPITRNFNMYFNPLWPVGSISPNVANPSGLTTATVNGRGQVRPNAVFGYKWGPKNIARLQETTDGTQLVNQAYVSTQYGTGEAQSTGSIENYGLFQEQIQITDQASPPSTSGYNYLANALAGVEVLTKEDPLRIWTFDQMPYTPGGSALQPFGVDFDIGDYCSLVSTYGVVIPGQGAGIAGKMPVRVFQYTVDISDEGVEQVKNVATTFQQSS